jgi:molecular chaperone GrpE
VTSQTPRDDRDEQPEQPRTEAAPAASHGDAPDDAAESVESSTPGGAGSTVEAKLAERTADLQRLQAEYVNYKRRVDRDRDLVRDAASAGVLAALLPVLDDIDRARDHGELEGGFKAVAESLERIVATLGLEKFGKPGEEFDPRIHEALMHDYADDVDTVTAQTILQVGYRVGDRVLRPARVAVVEPKPIDAPVTPDPTTPEPTADEAPGEGPAEPSEDDDVQQ